MEDLWLSTPACFQVGLEEVKDSSHPSSDKLIRRASGVEISRTFRVELAR